jgi:hypothetical protein
VNATPRLSGLQKSRCLRGSGRFTGRQASAQLLFPLANQKCSGDAVRRCNGHKPGSLRRMPLAGCVVAARALSSGRDLAEMSSER